MVAGHISTLGEKVLLKPKQVVCLQKGPMIHDCMGVSLIRNLSGSCRSKHTVSWWEQARGARPGECNEEAGGKCTDTMASNIPY